MHGSIPESFEFGVKQSDSERAARHIKGSDIVTNESTARDDPMFGKLDPGGIEHQIKLHRGGCAKAIDEKKYIAPATEIAGDRIYQLLGNFICGF